MGGFHEIWGTGRIWSMEEFMKFWKLSGRVRTKALFTCMLLTDNNTLPVSVWCGEVQVSK